MPRVSKDSAGLEPRQAGPFTVGYVDAIVGQGGVEVPGYIVTKAEILQLVLYWATEILEIEFAYFLYGCSGSSEWRTGQYAQRRLNSISSFIGENEMNKASTEAQETFARRVDPRAWRIFTEGTPEERNSFQRELDEKMAREYP